MGLLCSYAVAFCFFLNHSNPPCRNYNTVHLLAVTSSFLLTFGTTKHSGVFRPYPSPAELKQSLVSPCSVLLLSYLATHPLGVNLASPQTTQHQLVWVRAAGSVCKSGGAHHPCCTAGLLVLSSEDCPGHNPSKKGAVCTMGIGMNNPCFFFFTLPYVTMPILLHSLLPFLLITLCCIFIKHIFLIPRLYFGIL